MCDSAMTSPESDVHQNGPNQETFSPSSQDDPANQLTSPGQDSQQSFNSQNSQGTNSQCSDGDRSSFPKPGPSSKAQVKAQVKPFTKQSRDRLENKTVQLVREYGFQPRRKLSVEDGSVLPVKYEPFPSKLYGRPLEEIDNFIYEEVPFFFFIIITNMHDRSAYLTTALALFQHERIQWRALRKMALSEILFGHPCWNGLDVYLQEVIYLHFN